jgi:ABC-type polysaccharide/polyol phosphate export permease
VTRLISWVVSTLDAGEALEDKSMQRVSALNIPQSGPAASPYEVALFDIIAGVRATEIWGRLGWRETRRRYRRTVFGPFWGTLSLAIFVVTLGVVWANLWHIDPKVYLPFLTSGMLCWSLFSTICTEGCGGIVGYEQLIKQLRISYTLLACATVWRNVIVFLHNIGIYVLICLYAGVSISWAMLLAVPGLLMLCLNGLWIALLLGAVCARYRDIQQVVGSLLQISMFLTPILWSVDQLKGRGSTLIAFNPLYHLIAIVRDPMMGKIPGGLDWFVVGLITIFGWALTVYVMSKFRHRIVYWL